MSERDSLTPKKESRRAVTLTGEQLSQVRGGGGASFDPNGIPRTLTSTEASLSKKPRS